LVPHAERANTATFLEEVIKYIQVLQSRNASLERMIRDLQQTPLPGQGGAAAAAAAGGSGDAAGQLLMNHGANTSLPLAALSMPFAMDMGSQQMALHNQHQQQHMRMGTAGSGSLGSLGAQQDASAQGFAAAAAGINPGAFPLANTSPAAVTMRHHDAVAQSGAAALLAAAGATAAMAAASNTAAPGGKSGNAAAASSGGAGEDAAPTSSSGRPGAAADPPADAGKEAAADLPVATVKVPDVLQSLLPQGLDLQQMLQQALLSTQAQLLAQLQQHQQHQTSSGTAGAPAAAPAGGAAGAGATSSGGTSGQLATSTAPLSALQQALSGQHHSTHNPSTQDPAQQLPLGAHAGAASAGVLTAPPSLLLPGGSSDEAARQQQLLQPAPALNIGMQQQTAQPGSSADPGVTPVTSGLQDAAQLLALNEMLVQLRGSAGAGAANLPATTAALLNAAAAGRSGLDDKSLSPSAAASLPGASPGRRAAAPAAAGRTFSGGDGAHSSGAMPSLPDLLAMAPPAGVGEQRSSSMSGDRDDDGSGQAAKKRKMLVL
jgi:hypothetical protein